MKLLVIILLGLLPISSMANETKGEEKKAVEIWLKLSAQTQNTVWQFRQLGSTGQPDPSFFKKDLKTINDLLDNLVAQGELVEARVSLKSPNELESKGFAHLSEFVETLSETYGHFVTLELVDLGLQFRLSSMPPDKPLELRLRLPQKQLEEFRAMIVHTSILNNSGEQK